MELFGNFLLQTKEQEELKSFNTNYRLVSGNTDLEELYIQFLDILATKASEFQERDSGWALMKRLHLEIGDRRQESCFERTKHGQKMLYVVDLGCSSRNPTNK
ncbi:uncharacterized protein LOC132695810 [Cylas formicarius]|uniref:uncharacterized protein LOC132695810 n=1 Tax=Cylas formicarius TaxID=197179 RepID=UPI0029588F66|nr:uncharacterized protein LOC132695810 [Cylas formicarius]